MISEGSHDAEDWSNDAVNSALHKYIQIEKLYQYHCFYSVLITQIQPLLT